ncbi:MAG: NAD(+) synthase [Marinilabiliaceae bacterium]|nr:NAD(+) synthase [Marinilabiliaceae bacterium]
MKRPFSKEVLKIENVDQIVEKICDKLNNDVFHIMKRKGGVIGVSGGIDSSTTLALMVKALGADRIFAVMLPESDSSPDSKKFALQLLEKFGVEYKEENISAALEGFGCYKRRNLAVKKVVSNYDPIEDKMKIVIPPEIIKSNLPPVHYVTVIYKDGSEQSCRLPMGEYLQIVAASNFKQRSRMSMLYYHAERLYYAVIGTPNKHEIEQGFFVKYGDGGSDVFPIGDLYKTQVYQIARYLGVPVDIINRPPTTDTYSAAQTQEEFFYQLPFETMDLLWYAFENGYSPKEVSPVLEMSEEDVVRNYNNFERKRKTTDYLRQPPIRGYDFFEK